MKYSLIAILLLICSLALFAEDSDIILTDADVASCTLDDSFLTPVSGWNEYVTAKLDGFINPTDTLDPVTDPEATGKMVLAGNEFDPTVSNKGNKRNYWININDESIFGMLQGNFRWLEEGKWAVATMTQMQIAIKTLNYMKSQKMGEFTDSGAYTMVDDATFEIREEGAGLRKICHIGASVIKEIQQDGETYYMPEGKLFGCLENNKGFAAEENLAMMINTRITSDEAEIEKYFTTFNPEQTYKKCTCYAFERAANGNLVEEECASEIEDNDVTAQDSDITADTDIAEDKDIVSDLDIAADSDIFIDNEIKDEDIAATDNDTEKTKSKKSDDGCGCSLI